MSSSSHSAELEFALTLADIADEISLARYRALDLVITTKPDKSPAVSYTHLTLPTILRV